MANAADAEHLFMYAASGRHPLLSCAKLRVIDLSRDAEILRQVARADEQHINSVDRGNGLAILDTSR